MTELINSVRATYDSAETGPRYHVTTTVDGHVIGNFRRPMPDPFARTTVRVCLRDLLRGLLRGHLVVEVTVGADADLMADVLELDDQALIPGRTRKAAFHQSINEKLRAGLYEEQETP